MKRRNFLGKIALGGSAIMPIPFISCDENKKTEVKRQITSSQEVLEADVVVIGGGLGGFASTISALRNNKTVVLTEETDWIGGQLTQQGVPPDEHRWIEFTGSTQFYEKYDAIHHSHEKKKLYMAFGHK